MFQLMIYIIYGPAQNVNLRIGANRIGNLFGVGLPVQVVSTVVDTLKMLSLTILPRVFRDIRENGCVRS